MERIQYLMTLAAAAPTAMQKDKQAHIFKS
jgi:hypothetical protein